MIPKQKSNGKYKQYFEADTMYDSKEINNILTKKKYIPIIRNTKNENKIKQIKIHNKK